MLLSVNYANIVIFRDMTNPQGASVADSFGVPVSYPFGFWLTYTEFTYGEPEVTCDGEKYCVTLEVTNAGYPLQDGMGNARNRIIVPLKVV